MGYNEALQDLVGAATEAGLPLELDAPLPSIDAYVTMFPRELAEAIAATGYPGGLELPWAVEELYLYDLRELRERQAGYRSDASTGSGDGAWNHDRYVIADWAANPISIGSDGAISYSRHGEGSWTYLPLAPDLPVFFTMLAGWLRFFVIEHHGNVFNEDFEIPEATREQLKSLLRDCGADDADSAARFFLGEI